MIEAWLPKGWNSPTIARRFEEADAVVFHLPEWTADRMGPVSSSGPTFSFTKRPGQVWVGWSMECDEHYSYVLNRQFMRHFDLTMTYHLDADIPPPMSAPSEGWAPG